MSKTSKNNAKQATHKAREYAKEDTKIDLEGQKETTKHDPFVYTGKHGTIQKKKPNKEEIKDNIEISHYENNSKEYTMKQREYKTKTGKTIKVRPNNENKGRSSNTNKRAGTGNKNRDKYIVMNGPRTRDDLRGVKPEGKGEKALSQGYTTTAAKKKAESKAHRDYNKKRRVK